MLDRFLVLSATFWGRVDGGFRIRGGRVGGRVGLSILCAHYLSLHRAVGKRFEILLCVSLKYFCVCLGRPPFFEGKESLAEAKISQHDSQWYF